MNIAEIRRLKELSGITEDRNDQVFYLMKKSLLRGKWYLENEEMDPEMVSSELRDINNMLNAVEDGIDDISLVGLDTAVDEQYMHLHRQCAAKLKGAVSNIYGVDHDVLPLDAKPNPDSPYNSGQVEESSIAEEFEPHMMYDPKTGEGKHAKVEKDHLDMKAKGWGHDKPKAKDVKVKEGLGDLAHMAEKDHEVQMARAELYKLAKYAIKLHEMLKGVSEAEGLEGWVQAKITKSADMIGSVYHHLDYEESPMGEVTEEVDAPKMDVTDADKKANSPAYQKMKKGNPRYNDKTTKKVKESACNCDCGKAICESCGKAHKVSESGLQAHIGNKKYGKAGMDKLRKAGREGGGEEAKGKIKDKILGKKKDAYKESLQSKLNSKTKGLKY